MAQPSKKTRSRASPSTTSLAKPSLARSQQLQQAKEKNARVKAYSDLVRHLNNPTVHVGSQWLKEHRLLQLPILVRQRELVERAAHMNSLVIDFFAFPRELRDKIYEFALVGRQVLTWRPEFKRKDCNMAILRACKATYVEGIDIFYKRNLFWFELDRGPRPLDDFIALVGARNAELVRHVAFWTLYGDPFVYQVVQHAYQSAELPMDVGYSGQLSVPWEARPTRECLRECHARRRREKEDSDVDDVVEGPLNKVAHVLRYQLTGVRMLGMYTDHFDPGYGCSGPRIKMFRRTREEGWNGVDDLLEDSFNLYDWWYSV